MGFPQRPRQDVELSAQRVHVPTQQVKRLGKGRMQQSMVWRQKWGGNWTKQSSAECDTAVLPSAYSSVGKARNLHLARLYVPYMYG